MMETAIGQDDVVILQSIKDDHLLTLRPVMMFVAEIVGQEMMVISD